MQAILKGWPWIIKKKEVVTAYTIVDASLWTCCINTNEKCNTCINGSGIKITSWKLFRCPHKPKLTPPSCWTFFGRFFSTAGSVHVHTQATTLRNSNQGTHNVELHVSHIRSLSNEKEFKKKIWHAESNRPRVGLRWHFFIHKDADNSGGMLAAVVALS